MKSTRNSWNPNCPNDSNYLGSPRLKYCFIKRTQREPLLTLIGMTYENKKNAYL